ncbi:MAG: hypothetical protein QM796_06130 [Chthoniobacteraceae bacterium]
MSASPRTLYALITHQESELVGRMLAWWRDFAAEDQLLVLHGGTPEAYSAVSHPWKAYISDPRLRTTDHQREMQSYTAIYQAIAAFLQEHPEFDRGFISEYDHVPLARDFDARLRARLEREKADVIGCAVSRVDGTNFPHYLQAMASPGFCEFWKKITLREEPEAVLSMLGTGSFWTREALLEMGKHAEPFPIYHELYVPTLVHHLGFRIRPLGRDQELYVQPLGDLTAEVEKYRAEGAWTLHPVKKMWQQDS